MSKDFDFNADSPGAGAVDKGAKVKPAKLRHDNLSATLNVPAQAGQHAFHISPDDLRHASGPDASSWDGKSGAAKGPEAAAALGITPHFNYDRGRGHPDLVTLHAGDVNFPVAKQYAGNFQAVLDRLEERGYPFSRKGGAGGYVNRGTASGGKSQHARGNAIDVNPNDNPEGRRGGNNFPSDIGLISASAGIAWGGYMERKKGRGPDAMHFEFDGTLGVPAMTLEEYQQKKLLSAQSKTLGGAPTISDGPPADFPTTAKSGGWALRSATSEMGAVGKSTNEKHNDAKKEAEIVLKKSPSIAPT